MHAAVILVSTSARLNRRTRFCRQGIIPRGTQLHRALPTHTTQPTTITMKSLSPALASLANVFKIPMSMAPVRPSISRACHETLNRQTQQPGPVTAALQSAPFSTTSAMAARKGNGPVVDKRISTWHTPAPSSRPLTLVPSPEPPNQTKHVLCPRPKKENEPKTNKRFPTL